MYGFYPMLRTVRLEFGFRILNIFSTYGALRFITFSSHKDMVYKKSALQDIFVKLLFIEYRLSKKVPLIRKV